MKKVSIIFLLLYSFGLSAQVINNMVAVVGNKPITQYDLDKGVKSLKDQLKKNKNLPNPRKKIKSFVLDNLIEREIINYIAEAESIYIGHERIEEIIDNQMKAQGLKTEKQLEKALEKTQGISLSEYKKNIIFELKKQKVIQIRLKVPLPEQEQIKAWYKKNKRLMGQKVLLRVLTKNYKKNDVKDELRASKEMANARKEALKNFGKAAQKHSDHPTSKTGGLLGWVAVAEIARYDPVLAGAADKTKQGQISQVFVGNDGYYIIKAEKKEDISLNDAYETIQSIIYQENMINAYKDWILEQRDKVAVKIYLEDYQGI